MYEFVTSITFLAACWTIGFVLVVAVVLALRNLGVQLWNTLRK